MVRKFGVRTVSMIFQNGIILSSNALTQFLKRILGCDIHAPNLMVRGEVGERPLLVDILSRSALYIKQTAQNSGTIANIVLDNELSLYDDDNIFFLMRTLSSMIAIIKFLKIEMS